MNQNAGQTENIASALEKVEAVCREFRDGWKQGNPRSIEDCLAEFDESAHTYVFRNLLNLEIEFRRRAKQNPTSEEYIERFPQFARIVRQSFFQSTMLSLQSLHSTPGDGSAVADLDLTRTIDQPIANQLGDFELLHEIGRGGFGVVYEARHLKRGDRVALKTLPLSLTVGIPETRVSAKQKQQAGDRLIRFKREFRALANINHPNLVGLHDLENEGDAWFFTMDLIDGDDFLWFTRPDGVLDEARLRACLQQLVAGVMALHNQNIIHRDLKPSNVMVNDQGQLVILDFGLVTELGQRSELASLPNFGGTPAYAAPEQLTGEHTGASDWYAVGVMLYEALTGDRPFAGSGIEVLKAKENSDPPRPTNDHLPDDLVELTMRLLARKPSDRPDALSITESVSGELPSQLSATVGAAGPLIGREPHLKQLHGCLDQLQVQERAQCVFVSGRSGEGKTSLVEHFLEPLRLDRKFLVLSGRCYDRESVPFKALDSVIDNLCAYLQHLPEAEAALLLPDDLPFLVQLFPVLQRVEVIAKSDSLNVAAMDRAQVLQRGFMALRLMLSRIGKRRPIIIFSDDLQWGDADSAEALSKILTGDDTPRVMFIGTYRSDEVDESRFLQSWNKSVERDSAALTNHTIGLAPLTVEQCTQLVIQILELDDERIRRRAAEFAQKTGGNPYLLIELIGCFDPNTDSFEALSLPEILKRKLERLPPLAGPLLEVISVSGQALSVTEAFSALEQDSIDTSLITHMRSEKLIRLIGSEEDQQIDSYHDKIRESVRDELADSKRIEWHLSLAWAIEKEAEIEPDAVVEAILQGTDPGLAAKLRAADLAYQYDQAGEKERSLAYGLLAAETASLQFAYETAVQYFDIATKNEDSGDNGLRYRIRMGFGRARTQLGHYEQALEHYQVAALNTDDLLEISEANAAEAEIYQRSGQLLKSLNKCWAILRQLGVRIPKTNTGFVLLTKWYIFGHRLKKLLPAKAKRTPDPKRLLTIRVLRNSLVVSCWLHAARWEWALAKIAHRSVGFDHPLLEFFESGAISTTSLSRGNYRKFWPLYEQRIKNLEGFSDRASYIMFTRAGGYLQMVNGRYREAEITLAEVEKYSIEQVPDFYSVYACRSWRAYTMFQLAKFREVAQISRGIFENSVQEGHNRFAGFGLDGWSRATGGRIPFDELRSCFGDVSEDRTLTIQLLIAEAEWHLANARTAQAYESAAKGMDFIRRHGVLNPFSLYGIHCYMKMVREYAVTIEKSDPAKSNRLRRHALGQGRWQDRLKHNCKSQEAAHRREFGLLLADMGRIRAGYKSIKKGCEVAEQQGLPYELAKSRLALGQVGQKLGLPEAVQQIANATEQLDEFDHQMEQAARETTG